MKNKMLYHCGYNMISHMGTPRAFLSGYTLPQSLLLGFAKKGTVK